MSLDMFLQHCFNALTLGSLYALIAIGYTMVYGILRLINFAHGDILMVGAYFVFFGTFAFGWPWGIAAIMAIAGASLLGVVMERVAYRPLRDAPRISALISAIAVSFFIESLAVVVFTGQPRPVLQPEWLVSEWQVWGGVRILRLTAFVPAMTAVLVGILLYIVYRTKPGLAMRAISKDIETTRLLGVRVDNIIAFTFCIGSALAAASGIMWALRYPQVHPYMGIMPGLKAFIAAVFGGIGSIQGAVIGGVALGFVEIMTVAFMPELSGYRDAFAFVLLVLVLLFKPTGLLGERMEEKNLMRLNRGAILNIAAMFLLGCLLWQAESFLGDYQIYIGKLIFINIILALSLNLIYGFTGLFSLGHAGFIAVGAYVSALCILAPEQKEMMWILEPIIWPFSELFTPFWASVLAGGVAAAIFAFFIAVPVLRLGDDYLGIATLGFAEIIRVLIVNATAVTNGSLGIKGIPSHATLLACYGWALFTLIVLARLVFSNFGNVLRCIRDNEIAASVMGINVFRYKVLSFCIGAFFAGVGGALLGSHLSTIDPKMFNFLLTFNVLMFVVAGGLGSLTGSILGATVITILLEWLRAIEEPMNLGFVELPGIPGMRMVVFSLVLLAIILYRREGIMGTRELTWTRIFAFLRRHKA